MAVPQLQFKACELDSITLSWDRIEGTGYKLEFREILVPDWAGCRSETIAPSRPAGIPSSPSTEFCITVTDLNPSSSYIFRLYTIAPDGQEIGPGPEIAFDTEVVSCAPKRQSCCTIS
ncbi:unnamed protein product [Pylaiella littoralis]